MGRHAKSAADLIAATGASKCTPVRQSDRWECWAAEYKVVVTTVRQNVVFLNRVCRWQDLDEVSAFLTSLESDATVVVRESGALRGDLTRVKKRFSPHKVIMTNQFLFTAVNNALAPSDVLAGQTDPYFIEPSVQFPTEEEPGPALGQLNSWLRGQADTEFNVAVLLAPAGVGKTTLSEQLFRQMLSQPSDETIPLLLKREQWESLASRGAVQLRDIWTAAITTWYPRSLLGSENLDTYLGAGAIRPIFDGLDELCSGFPADFGPTQLIEDLADTFEDGRLLVTSRTQFWNEHVDKSVRSRVLELDLHPFSPKQRDSYLSKRFPVEGAKRTAAVRILEKVSGRLNTANAKPAILVPPSDSDSAYAARFDVMPYAVMLVAESVDVDSRTAEPVLDEAEPITGLLKALCERERQRQRLSLSADTQFKLLEILAVEFGESFAEDDFELVASSLASDLPRAELDRLRHHALLRRKSDRFRFRYDFVQEYLAARRLNRWLLSPASDLQLGKQALKACETRPAGLIDRWIDFARQASEAQVTEALRSRWREHADDSALAGGLSHLALSYARALSGGDKAIARKLLDAAVGTPPAVLRGLRIRGAVAGLDLNGAQFIDCQFSDTEWTKCLLDERTVFLRCRFEGRMSVKNVTGFGLAALVECDLSAHAANSLQQERLDDRSVPITDHQIDEAVRETLRLFSVGNLGFNPIAVPKVEKHVQNYSFGDKLLRTLVKERVLDVTKKNLSGDAERYEVVDSYAARQYLNDAVKLGGIRNAFTSLSERLIK